MNICINKLFLLYYINIIRFGHPVERLYSVCAYILYIYIYTAGTGHTRMQHAHAWAAKQSELVRRCIATTALFALSGVHPAGGLARPAAARLSLLPLPFLATLASEPHTLGHALALFAPWLAKERVIASRPSPGKMLERSLWQTVELRIVP